MKIGGYNIKQSRIWAVLGILGTIAAIIAGFWAVNPVMTSGALSIIISVVVAVFGSVLFITLIAATMENDVLTLAGVTSLSFMVFMVKHVIHLATYGKEFSTYGDDLMFIVDVTGVTGGIVALVGSVCLLFLGGTIFCEWFSNGVDKIDKK